MSVRVYKYGLQAPLGREDAILAEQTLRQGHTLYNQCIEVHRDKALRLRTLYGPEVASAYNALEAKFEALGELRDQINLLRSTRSVEPNQHQAKVDDLKAQCQKVKAEIDKGKADLAAMRKAAWADESFKEQAKLLDQQAYERLREIRQASGLNFGSYNAILADAAKAKATSLGLPRFARYEGEGSLTHQMIASATGGDFNQRPDGIFGSGNRMNSYVQVVPDDRPTKHTEGSRRDGQRRILRWLVGPVKEQRYLEFPMVMHRPLPPEGRVALVKLVKRKQANRNVWTVQFTVKVPDVTPVEDPKRAIAFDVGWRKVSDDTLRVAYWYDTDGDHGEVRLPDSVRQRLDKAEDIQSLRSRKLDDIKVWLKADLSGKALSDEVKQAVAFLHNTRSAGKLASLWNRHKDELSLHLQGLRLDYKDDKHLANCGNYLQAWLARDKHLWQYETGLRSGALRCRDDLYAKLAVDSARKYDLVAFENLKVASMARLAKPEKKADLPDSQAAMKEKASGQRQVSAPATLISMFRNTVSREGKLFVQVEPANTTKIHAACGHKQVGLQAELVYTCEHCGMAFDQDFNAAQNILQLGLAAIG